VNLSSILEITEIPSGGKLSLQTDSRYSTLRVGKETFQRLEPLLQPGPHALGRGNTPTPAVKTPFEGQVSTFPRGITSLGTSRRIVGKFTAGPSKLAEGSGHRFQTRKAL
jgi:hypothetical protein